MNMSVQTDPVYCYIGSATEQPTVMTGMTKLTVNTTVCTFRIFLNANFRKGIICPTPADGISFVLRRTLYVSRINHLQFPYH